jgi:transposase InsO family protein
MAVYRRDTGPPGAQTGAQTARALGRPGVVHHSDHGSQYTSFAFSQRLADTGITASLGSIGDSFDNGMAESWFGTIYRRIWRTRHEAEWQSPRTVKTLNRLILPFV